MIAAILHALHVPAWICFVIIFAAYFLAVGWWMINGYAMEYMGWRHPGQPGKIHKVIYRWHTGLHIDPKRSYGDEKHLRRASGSMTRVTPEGLMVYFSPMKRGHRALRNNLITILWLVFASLMSISPRFAITGITALAYLFAMLLIFRGWIRLRKKHVARVSHQPALSYSRKARKVFSEDILTKDAKPLLTEETKPQLEGAPHSVIAQLLAGEMNCSTAEVLNNLSMTADQGKLKLPDSFAAKVKQREPVEEVIVAHTKGTVKFSWITTETPRRVEWVPVQVHKLPDYVRFRDYLDQIERLGPRELGIGLEADRSLYPVTHNGDLPWHCRFAGTGTGKSMGFLVKAAQICHKDPAAEVYCVDTKQVSFEHARGIPRVYVFDNPQSEMKKIWDVFYHLTTIMDERYTAVRQKRKKFSDFHDIWLLVDEGNDLAAQLKSYWRNVMEESSASPSIWGECVARLLRQGRQARIFGEWMFQDLDGRIFGGESLKMAFSVFGAAGYLPGQFTRTIGPPAPDCLEGPGRILMCRGNKRTWVQGFCDDPDWLHEYALENRKEIAA
jgi:hypothetical protein